MIKLGLSAIMAFVILFFVWPSPIDSVAVQPSEPLPMTGALAANDRLQSIQVIPLPKGQRGGEDVALDANGCLHTGTESGHILRQCAGADWQVLAHTSGRPLGLHFDVQGNLIIADAAKGLLSMTPSGELSVLVDHYQGERFGFVDDVDIGADGTMYFSDASSRYTIDNIVLDVLDGRPSGRLFAYQPNDNSLTLLADGLAFANGVAVAADQHYVLVNETFRYQISRVWLSGERAGEREILLDQLPGMPDGIARAPDGTYWVAMYGLRPELVDRVHSYPWLKNQLAKLPDWLAPIPKPYGFILQINSNGDILQSLHDRAGVAIGEVTSVQPEVDGLYLGTLHMGRLGKVTL